MSAHRRGSGSAASSRQSVRISLGRATEMNDQGNSASSTLTKGAGTKSKARAAKKKQAPALLDISVQVLTDVRESGGKRPGSGEFTPVPNGMSPWMLEDLTEENLLKRCSVVQDPGSPAVKHISVLSWKEPRGKTNFMQVSEQKIFPVLSISL